MDVGGASVYQIEGGKIKYQMDYWDFATGLGQLGTAPRKQ